MKMRFNKNEIGIMIFGLIVFSCLLFGSNLLPNDLSRLAPITIGFGVLFAVVSYTDNSREKREWDEILSIKEEST